MAKFTTSRPISVNWFPGIELAGTGTHRIPDALVEEFQRDIEPLIPGGVTWITQDETTSAFPASGGTITGDLNVTGAVTGSAIGGVIQVTAASALQVAIDSISATGGVIRLPAGTYTLSAGLTIPGNDISLEGAGPTVTKIVWTGASAAIRNSVTTVIRRRFTMRDICISNSDATTSAGGVRLENFYDALIERCQFEGIGASGVGVEFYGTGSTYYNKVRDSFFNCSVSGSRGVKLTAGAANPNAESIEGCTFSGAAGSVLVDVGVCDTLSFIGNMVANASSAEINVSLASGATYGRYVSNRFETGSVTCAAGANYNRFVANTYAGTAPFTNSGSNNVRVAEPDSFGAGLPGVHAYNIGSVSTSSGVQTVIPLSDERYDSDGFHTNTSRLTIPTGLGGRYRVSANIVWDATTVAGYRKLQILVNGSTVPVREHIFVSTSGTDRQSHSLTTTLALVAGDYVEMAAQQSSGTINVNGSAAFYYPELMLELLRP